MSYRMTRNYVSVLCGTFRILQMITPFQIYSIRMLLRCCNLAPAVLINYMLKKPIGMGDWPSNIDWSIINIFPFPQWQDVHYRRYWCWWTFRDQNTVGKERIVWGLLAIEAGRSTKKLAVLSALWRMIHVTFINTLIPLGYLGYRNTWHD